MKKILNLFIFLIGFSFYTYSYAEKNLEQDKYPSSAIWKIQTDRFRGTGFFISPNLFVTNFHVVDDVIDSFDLRISLSQETHSRVLNIKRVYALSALDDLVILETKESVTNWLDIADNTPKPYEKLFAIGYLGEHWAKIRKTGKISYQNKYIYSFLANRPIIGGFSGSPVLNQENQIVGILFLGASNTASAIKVKRLKKLLVENSQNTNLTYESIKEEAIQKIKTLAKKEPFAQYQLARIYYEGIGIEQNFEQAFDWFQKSAEQGFALAQHKLALMYDKGRGVEENVYKAFYWTQQAAEQGFALAQHKLALMYDKGRGVEEDPLEAFYWYKKAAVQGELLAQYNLGLMYYNGIGIEQNFEKAFYWFQKSAEQGEPLAQYNLAWMYYYGRGVEKNVEQTFYWYKKAAEQGDADAQYNLGLMYYNGIGVEKDLEKAFYWYQKSAEQGIVLAQYNLGLMYYSGIGVELNFDKAFYWYQKSAEQGLVLAQYNLGLMYYSGIGVELNFDKAFYWFQQAARQGDADAQNKLDSMYYYETAS